MDKCSAVLRDVARIFEGPDFTTLGNAALSEAASTVAVAGTADIQLPI